MQLGKPLPAESVYSEDFYDEDFAFVVAHELGFRLFDQDKTGPFKLYHFPGDD